MKIQNIKVQAFVPVVWERRGALRSLAASALCARSEAIDHQHPDSHGAFIGTQGEGGPVTYFVVYVQGGREIYGGGNR
ncbi:hypothetical protein LY76DRAFT_590605 [Colletotrichum caudatum]|nr:hypothetical protein LY76DRAFT_590605 [Colletotrichum caudatum]